MLALGIKLGKKAKEEECDRKSQVRVSAFFPSFATNQESFV